MRKNTMLLKRCLHAGLSLIALAGLPALAQSDGQSSSLIQLSSASQRGSAPSSETCVEDFEDIPSLYTENGWLRINNSIGRDNPASPYRTFWEAPSRAQLPDGWAYDFGAQSGSPKSRVLAAGNGLAGEGEIANAWLLTPQIQFQPGNRLSFWTRAIGDVVFGGFVERMYVRVCTDGDCTDVGSGPDDVGAYTTTLVAINEAAQVWNAPCYSDDPRSCDGYPTNWRRYTVDLPATGSGRVAFQYHTPGVGMLYGEGVQIGVDTVEIEGTASCPLRHNRLFSNGFDRIAWDGGITQNLDNRSVDPSLDIWTCFSGQDYRNVWVRRFDLHAEQGLSGRVAISSLDLGIFAAEGNQYIPVRLYALPTDAALAYSNMSLIGQAELPVYAGDYAVIRNLPLTAVLADAEQQDLVVEIAPQYGATYREFWPGMNSAGQTAPTYYSGVCQTTGNVSTGNSIVNLATLLFTQSTEPMYTPDDSLVITIHAEQRPAGNPEPSMQ
jgi:hypothetical protein